MRTIIDIPEKMIEALSVIGKLEKKSRAALIREAIQHYLQSRTILSADDQSFGIWKDKEICSLKYERKLRKEWE